jgi:hypothetical protein
MPAIAPFGVLLFALQVGLGYYAYRSRSAAGTADRLLVAALVTAAGVVALFEYGVVPTLLLDAVLAVALTWAGGGADSRPNAR